MSNENKPINDAFEPAAADSAARSRRAQDHVTGWDLLQGVVLIWTFDISLMLIVVVFGILSDIAHENNAGQRALVIFIITLLSTAVTTAVSWYFVCRKYRLDFRFGFAITRVNRSTTLTCILIGFATAAAASLGVSRLIEGKSPLAELISTPEGIVVFAVLGVLLVPFEEIYYRGFIFPGLKRKIGAAGAVPLTAIWFALAHLKQLAGDWAGLGMILFIGIIYTLLRHVYDSLTPPIIAHLSYNCSLIVITLLTFIFA